MYDHATLRRLAVLLLACCGLLGPAGAAADELPAIRADLERLDANDPDRYWHFTMDIVEDGEHRVIASDPTRPRYEKRELLQVNGASPDAGQLKTFRKEEVKRVDDIDPEARGYAYLVDLDSLEKLSADGRRARYRFVPRINRFEKARNALAGELVFNSLTGHIEEIAISNSAELQPVFSVSVHIYRLSFRFRDEQGRRLLDRMHSHAEGKAGFVKSFESTVEVSFRDYRPGPRPAAYRP